MLARLKQRWSNQPIATPLTLWLSDAELLSLRSLAQQIDTAASPNHSLQSRSAGNLPTRALGSGMDYAESRIYQAGDDPRSINWRLSARSQETWVKSYHIESRPSMSILLDQRRPMIFGTRKRLKIMQATRLACLLAFAADVHHLDFQAWIMRDSQSGNRSIHAYPNIHEFLLQANQTQSTLPLSTPTTSQPAQAKNNSLAAALQDIQLQTASGSLIYLISDFADLEAAHQTTNIQNTMADLQHKHFVEALHIYDQAELKLPELSSIYLHDMYQNRQIKLHKKEQQDTFEKQAKLLFNQKKTRLKNLGIDYQSIASDVDDIQTPLSLPLGLA